MTVCLTLAIQIKHLLHKVHAQRKTCGLEFAGTGSVELVRQRTVNTLERS